MPTTPIPVDAKGIASTLDGQYEILREIGRGGMGIVYLARDLKLDRLVAIKTLPPHLRGDLGVRERFVREARLAAALSHPNVVPVHRADEIDGHVFFVMGLVDGESLASRVRAGGPLAPSAVARVMRDVAEALDYAHTKQVIHRDIKAENILLDHVSGRAVVTDFGIARMAEAAPTTATGQVLGTVYYLSPEQIAGETVDGRSDIYSLGVVGYYAATGHFPFDAELASAVLIAHVNKSFAPINAIAPSVPATLAAVIERCLSKNPAHRYQRGQELADALSAIGAELAALPPAPKVPLISDTEAHAIFERASHLEANTGLEPRPLPLVGERDKGRDAARTSGHAVNDIRSAAADAGIPAKYVEHALVERGLSQAGARQTQSAKFGVLRDITPEAGSAFVGAPTDIHLEIVLDGEMSDRDHDLLNAIIHRYTGELGSPGAVGRSFTWTSQARSGRSVHVAVIPRNGKTMIRVSDSVRPIALMIYIFGGIGGFMFTGALLEEVGRFVGTGGVLSLFVGSMSAAYLAARLAYHRIRASRERVLEGLVKGLAEQVEESIDQP